MEEAEKKLRISKRKLAISWAYYIIVCTFLAILNYTTSSQPWVLWVIGAWGMAQIIQTTEYLINKKFPIE